MQIQGARGFFFRIIIVVSIVVFTVIAFNLRGLITSGCCFCFQWHTPISGEEKSVNSKQKKAAQSAHGSGIEHLVFVSQTRETDIQFIFYTFI